MKISRIIYLTTVPVTAELAWKELASVSHVYAPMAGVHYMNFLKAFQEDLNNTSFKKH